MNFKIMVSTFAMIFIAELGDKTQLATLSFAAESNAPLSVFIGAAVALGLTSLIAVLIGEGVARFVPAYIMRYIAGGLFLLLGLLIIFVRR